MLVEFIEARREHVDPSNRRVARAAREHSDRYGMEGIFVSFALRQFGALHALKGDTTFCFRARTAVGATQHVCVKSISKQVGDRQSSSKTPISQLEKVLCLHFRPE
jgi:hypothetical protein